MGEGEDANGTTPQTAAQTLNEELKDPSTVQSYHVPCEPALIGIDHWMPTKLVDCLTAKPVDCLTIKLVDRLTAKLMNHLTAKLVNRLTTKLVNCLTMVVNLVKLHVTKLKKKVYVLVSIVQCY